MIIIYIHALGCLWFVITEWTKEWDPPLLAGLEDEFDFYTEEVGL